MTITTSQVLLLIESRKIEANPKYNGRVYKIGGDCDALEYGAVYANNDLDVFRFSGRDWNGYEDRKHYLSNEFVLGWDELICYFEKYGASYGIELDSEFGSVSDCVCVIYWTRHHGMGSAIMTTKQTPAHGLCLASPIIAHIHLTIYSLLRNNAPRMPDRLAVRLAP